jgi:hypothetical protein
MFNEDLKLKLVLSNQRNKRNVPPSRRWLRQRLGWTVTACAACLFALGTHSVGSPPGEREQAISLSHASDFAISKAEGRDGDEIYVTYTKKDCFLSGVNSAVAFHYKSGAEVTVVLFWPQWLSGETKTFTNTEFCQGPIQKAAFWGTARENSIQGGKKTATRVTFSERKSF